MKKAFRSLCCKDRLENKNLLHIPLGINVENNFLFLMLFLLAEQEFVPVTRRK